MPNIDPRGDLNRAESLLQDVNQQIRLKQFDESTTIALEEAIRIFERLQIQEKLMEVYAYWADFQASKYKLTNAIEFLSKSLRIREVIEQEPNEQLWRTHYQLGDWHNALNNFQPAKIHLDKALNIAQKLFGEKHPNTINTLTEYGEFYFNQYQFDKAIPIFQKAEQIVEAIVPQPKEILSGIYSDLAVNYSQVFEDDLAMEYYQKTIQLKKSLYHSMHSSLAMTYMNYSEMLQRKGDVNRAILFLNKAIDINEYNKIGGVSTVYPYRSLLQIHALQGDFDKAIEYGEKALEILETYNIRIHRATFAVTMSLGADYMRVGNTERSLKLLSKALQISRKLQGNNNFLQSSALLELGLVYTEIEEFAKAEQHFQEALEISKGIKHLEFRGIPDIHRGIGILREKTKNFPAALKEYQKVLVAITAGYDNEDFYDYPFFNFKNTKFEIKQNHDSWLSIILIKANAFLDFYLQQSNDLKDLKASFRGYELAFHFLDQIRQSFQSEHSKLLIVQKTEKYLLQAVEVSYLLYEATQEVNYLQSAFEFSEKNKAYLMLQTNAEKIAKQHTEIPKELLNQEQSLISQLAKLKKKIQSQNQQLGEEKTAILIQLKNEYFKTYNAFEAFKVKLENDYPTYYQLKYNICITPIKKIQQSLNENQTILSYFVGKSKIYLFCITSEELEVFRYNKPENWNDLLQEYLYSIKYHKKTNFQKVSFDLYRILLQEATHHLINAFSDEPKQLFIIPHAELHFLPFETLIIRQAEKEDTYQNLDYLLQYSQISYHYSTTLLHFDLQENILAEPAPAETTFTGFAPVYNTSTATQQIALESLQSSYTAAVNRSNAVRSDGTWIPLPHSKTEVENIAQLFDKQGLSSQNFLFEAANKSNLENQISKSRFVLIAAHGIVNHEYPELSGLVLASKTTEKNQQQRNNSKQKKRASETFLPTEQEIYRSLEETAVEDCILNMKEVAMMPMNADLVVLSSCESGIGELYKGEGMMAVNRGFLESGAKNVVSTLFKVNDKASSELTQLMFQYILEGENYATALQRAKLDLLKRTGMTPKAWSGFVLFGTGIS